MNLFGTLFPLQRFKKNHGDDFEVLPIGKPRKVASAETQDADTLERKELDLPPELAPESSLHEKFRRCNDDHLTEVPSRHEGQEQDLLVCTICHIKGVHVFFTFSDIKWLFRFTGNGKRTSKFLMLLEIFPLLILGRKIKLFLSRG